jgi:CRISPR system Cascade subunit CasE
MIRSQLHLIKVPLRMEKLTALAARRGIRARDLDEGYLAHCVVRELWQESAPAPFVLRGRARAVDLWGYSRVDANWLVTRAHEFGDPSILECLDGLDAIVSKEMPRFDAGRQVGFLTRVCPVARLARPTHGHKAGAEVDVFLARAFASGKAEGLSREEVYREWFSERMRDASVLGARITSLRVAGIARSRVVRRTQGESRHARALERPDVRIEGNLSIEDGDAFLRFLAHGVGRHRGFGFGAVLVVPPGHGYEPG